MPVTLTNNNFKEETSRGITLVDFWASWCGPCRRMAPVIDELAEEMTEVKFGKVNVDEEAQLSDMYRIEVIPTLMVFKDGKAVSHVSGVISKSELRAMIEKNK
jgi:thioredoxin 1